MTARIYQPAKTAMQSGRAKAHHWVLDFEQAEAKRRDPLMGWTSSGDTRQQLRLEFESREEAIAYAERNGVPYTVQEPKARTVTPKSYADNFAWKQTR
jgi:hypothetical protein